MITLGKRPVRPRRATSALNLLRLAAARASKFMSASDLAMTISAVGTLGFGDVVSKPVEFFRSPLICMASEMSPQGIVDALVALQRLNPHGSHPDEMMLYHLVKLFLRKRKHGVHGISVVISFLEFLVMEIALHPEAVCWQVFVFAMLQSLQETEAVRIGESGGNGVQVLIKQAAHTLVRILPELWDLLLKMWLEMQKPNSSLTHLPIVKLPNYLMMFFIESIPQIDAALLGPLCKMPHATVWMGDALLPHYANALLAGIAVHSHDALGAAAIAVTVLCSLAADVITFAKCGSKRTPGDANAGASLAEACHCLYCTLTAFHTGGERGNGELKVLEETLLDIGRVSVRRVIATTESNTSLRSFFGEAPSITPLGYFAALRHMSSLGVPSGRFLSCETGHLSSMWMLTALARRRFAFVSVAEDSNHSFHHCTTSSASCVPQWVMSACVGASCCDVIVTDAVKFIHSWIQQNCVVGAALSSTDDASGNLALAVEFILSMKVQWNHRPKSSFSQLDISLKSMSNLFQAANALLDTLHRIALMNRSCVVSSHVASGAYVAVVEMIRHVFDATSWQKEFSCTGGAKNIVRLLLNALPTQIDSNQTVAHPSPSQLGPWSDILEQVITYISFDGKRSDHVDAVLWFIMEVHRRDAAARLSGPPSLCVDTCAVGLLRLMLQHPVLGLPSIICDVFNSLTVEEALLVARESLNANQRSWDLLRCCTVYFTVHIRDASDAQKAPTLGCEERLLEAFWVTFASPVQSDTQVRDRIHFFLSHEQVLECSRIMFALARDLIVKGNAPYFTQLPPPCDSGFLRSGSWGTLCDKLRAYPQVEPLFSALQARLRREEKRGLEQVDLVGPSGRCALPPPPRPGQTLSSHDSNFESVSLIEITELCMVRDEMV